MSKFFQNDIAAHAGNKTGLRNVEFKKRNFDNSAAAAAGTILEIIPVHIKNPPVIQFVAYLEALSDNFQIKYQQKQPYGRTDPYYIWEGNSRSISVSFAIPNTSVSHALDNLNNLSWLAASVYPTYRERVSANSIAASPLWRIRYANLIASRTSGGQGALCKFDSLRINYGIEDGYIAIPSAGQNAEIIKSAGFDNLVRSGDNILVPKIISVDLDLDIIHDHALGWDYETGNWRGGRAAPGYPYGFGLNRDATDSPGADPAGGVQTEAASAGIENAPPGSPQAQEANQRQLEIFDTDDAANRIETNNTN